MLLEQDLGRKADHKLVRSRAFAICPPQSSDPLEGARLVRAFLRIADPEIRLAIVHMVEKMGSAPEEC